MHLLHVTVTVFKLRLNTIVVLCVCVFLLLIVDKENDKWRRPEALAVITQA